MVLTQPVQYETVLLSAPAGLIHVGPTWVMLAMLAYQLLEMLDAMRVQGSLRAGLASGEIWRGLTGSRVWVI